MLFRDMVTRQRGTPGTGGHGEPVIDWTTPATAVYPAEVQPVSTAEALAAQQRTETRWKAFLPFHADVEPTDRILWDSVVYEVDGDVEKWKRRRIGHHLEVFLIRFEGA
jgi:Phage head-tail joining protein